MAARSSQNLTLSVIQPTSAAVRLSQSSTLALGLPTSALVRVSQSNTLALALPTTAVVRFSQSLVLALVSNNLLLQLHVKKPITAWLVPPETTPQRGSFQHAALLAATPVFPPGQFIPRMLTVHAAVEEYQQSQPRFGRVPSPRRRGPSAWVIT